MGRVHSDGVVGLTKWSMFPVGILLVALLEGLSNVHNGALDAPGQLLRMTALCTDVDARREENLQLRMRQDYRTDVSPIHHHAAR